jgi:hypothetical protein
MGAIIPQRISLRNVDCCGGRLDSDIVDRRAWSDYARRYQAWRDAALAPQIVNGVYFVATPEESPAAKAPALLGWNRQARSFEVTPRPTDLVKLKSLLSEHDRRFDLLMTPPGSRGRGVRGFLPALSIGDTHVISSPIVRFARPLRLRPRRRRCRI